jgi:hypothetical protein
MTPDAQPTEPPTDNPTAAVRVPLTARIDADLHAGLREAADELDWSTNSALNEAVREWLQRRDANRARVDRPDAANVVDVAPVTGSGTGALRLLVDGYPVPYIEVHKVDEPGFTGDAFGKAMLTLDNRYATQAVRWDEFWRWAWFLANAMAVAAGYSSHGPNATRVNRHGPNENVDLAAWAEHGWSVHAESGQLGRTYELALTFRFPNMADGDLQAYSLREEIVRFLTETGARDVVTRLIALGPMLPEPPTEPVASPS